MFFPVVSFFEVVRINICNSSLRIHTNELCYSFAADDRSSSPGSNIIFVLSNIAFVKTYLPFLSAIILSMVTSSRGLKRIITPQL